MHAAVAIAGEAINQIRIRRMPNRAFEIDRDIAFTGNVDWLGLKAVADAEIFRVKTFEQRVAA